jgi:hypothetical protein
VILAALNQITEIISAPLFLSPNFSDTVKDSAFFR